MASAELLKLQNQLKRAPQAFIEDFLRQQQHFNSSLQIFRLEAKQNATRTKEFASLLGFMCQVAPFYKDRCTELPDQLLTLLESCYETLDPYLRKTLVQGLLLLQNRKLIDRLKVLPVFFTLFRASDKNLRALIFNHIVNDIRNLNKKKANPKLNATLQNFVVKMIKDDNAIAAQKSLGVMVELWRRQVWANEKTVNAIADACFSSNIKVLYAALHFFLGVAPAEDDEEPDSKARMVAKQVRMQQVVTQSVTIVHTKHRKKRERELKRAVKAIKQIKTADVAETKISASAIQLLHDPQQFTERLFASMKKGEQSLELRMLMMNVISRIVGFHKLILFNFYPTLQKYMLAHQKDVTMILTFLAQASHELVDPDVLAPCVGTLANNFVTDRSSPAVMAVGLNAIREVCSRCPLAMSQELLVDLAQYKKSKEKGVMMAARSLIALFRNINPALLAKKDRGKASALMMQAGELFDGELEYGALRPLTDVPGAALLAAESGFAEGDDAWKEEQPKELDSDEEEVEPEVEAWVDEEGDGEKVPKKRKVGEAAKEKSSKKAKTVVEEDEHDFEEDEGDEGDEGDGEGMLETLLEEGEEGDDEKEEECPPLAQLPLPTDSKTGVLCGTCGKAVSARVAPGEMKEGWQCDSSLHEGERKMLSTSEYYGCGTTEKCDWSMCAACFKKAQGGAAVSIKKALPISATRILTPRDFQRIKELRERHDQELKTKGKKRTREDGSTLLGVAKDSGSVVNTEDIVGWVRKERLSKAERLASIHEGRTGRDKFGAPKSKQGGTTNEAKLRNKPWQLTKDRGKKGKTASMKSRNNTLTTHIKNLKSRQKNKRKKKYSH
jgi:protein SDA1